ncbi:zinc ribbon domain-containing protein [Staphylococcus capitis]|uniref:zinc ribbon domain-containing protein n=1 Tax=Staphylococcus capitis TaxID=29388 RepID=UPI000D1B324C|nr:zinc-ribbon domain-containing protein [Staphylococcus capitis]PTH08599.1 zinc ribbon domain-containing protein [Staphylococcus capitis]
MKYCSNCGKPLRDGVKVCTNCGTPVYQQGSNQSHHQYQNDNNYNHHSRNDNKKTWIIASIIIVVIIALIALFLILKSQFSPEKQASHISHAIKKDDAKALSKEVTSGANNSHLSEEEARAYLNFIKEEDDLTNVANNIEQNAEEVKNNHYRNTTVDANGNNILNISKNGKKVLFFDDYQFNVPQHSVSLLASNSGKVTYQFGGEKHSISVDENEEKELGTFPIGNYNLKATKNIDGKKFKGAITIDMSDNTSTAYESFKQKRFNVYVDNGYALDHIKIYANGKEIGDESSSETYGPYDPDEEVVVHAEGTYEGKTFKSNSVNVASASDEDGGVTDVDLKFDEDDIDKYVEDDIESDSDMDSDEDDSGSGEVTRDNVIDKVESYEGHKLDTSEYTYKEPEKTDDGNWGFSFTDKDGDLAGSYTVDSEDGEVTEYDENGDEVGSGY